MKNALRLRVSRNQPNSIPTPTSPGSDSWINQSEERRVRVMLWFSVPAANSCAVMESPPDYFHCIPDYDIHSPHQPFYCAQCVEDYSGVYPVFVNPYVHPEDPWHSTSEQIYCSNEQLYNIEIAKKEIYDVKQQRLYLAQDEYNHLQTALTTLNTSRTSLCSSSSSVSTKYDPDLLKSDVALARNRVSRIKRELEQIRTEMSCTQRGVETLASVEQKLSSHHYNITEAQAIMTELRNIQKSLSSGEKEKAELMQSLAKLKDDLTRLQLCESSPDVSTLSLPQEKLSTASQTDLSGELVPIGTRLAEMARMRLQYDEARKRIQIVQQQLADLEEKVTPGQAESDKDRLRLHEEKQLLLQQLRDALRSMTQLESQLKTLSASTLSVSSSSSLGSLSTTSSKGSLSSGLSFTDIYGGPQCLGLSNISVSSEKPIDMVDLHRRVERLLRTGSSESSNLLPSPTSGRSQQSLSPRSSLSSVSPPISPLYDPALLATSSSIAGPPPAYEQVERQRRQQHLVTSLQCLDKSQLEDRLAELRINQQHIAAQLQQHDYAVSGSVNGSGGKRVIPANIALDYLELTRGGNMSQGSGLGRPSVADPPLSPISETPPPMLDDSVELLQVAALSTPSSSGTNTRSVSAAVSDESVAGDSGVFEASNKKRSLMAGNSAVGLEEMNLETAQVQIKLRYSVSDSLLHVGIERARNLVALFVPDNSKVYIKAALLPNPPPVHSSCCTKTVEDLRKPTFGDNFPLAVPLNKLYTKTLQVNVWCIDQNHREDCVVSLADFSPESVSVKWYNILSFRFMQPPSEVTSTSSDTTTLSQLSNSNKEEVREKVHGQQESEISVFNKQITALKEESLQSTVTVRLEELDSQEEEEEEDEDEEEEDDDDDDDEEGIIVEFCQEDILEDVLEHAEDTAVMTDSLIEFPTDTHDKETNTECVFIPEKGIRRRGSGEEPARAIVIKRSQTFSPSAAVSKNQYICRLNRSDSDSSMPLYRRGGPFQRNSIERRSLRWRRPPGSVIRTKHHRSSSSGAASSHYQARTSLDLELDLQAQHTRLQTLQDELSRLRELKSRLETARAQGDQELAAWVLEDQQFQNLVAQVESGKNGKNPDDRRVEKMLKKTSKEIYKLRKSKAGKGKPDVISFKEKMAFFTRVNLTVPVFPNTTAIEDGASSECSTLKRGESLHCEDDEDVDEEDDDDGLTSSCPTSYLTVTTDSEESANVGHKPVDMESADNREVEGRECIERNSEETQRYHYVVDRVLGVEV
ncbi:hypothetical protein C0J52_12889 [Blattella germanica]|nr:hypothetical protein C0J52_12889 [Blattella germanica]